MRSIRNRIAMAGVAGALLIGGATTASAAWVWYGSDNYYGGGRSYGYVEPGFGYMVGSPVAGHFDDGYAGRVGVAPQYGAPAWNCTTQGAAGRQLPCDYGGGF